LNAIALIQYPTNMQLTCKFTIILLTFITSMLNAQEIPQLNEVKSAYERALTDEESARNLYTLLSEANSSEPCIMAYEGGTNALMCLYVKNPMKRLKYAKNANKLINSAVEKDPTNLDVRFMRLAFGAKSPKMLGYSKFLEKDIAFVSNTLINEDIPLSTANYIYGFLKSEELCDASTLQEIQKKVLLAKK